MAGCGALVGAALFACLAHDPACLPLQHRGHLPILRAVAEQESRFNPYALRDEATGESKFYSSATEAIREAVRRDAAGRVLGLGMFQITFRSNWRRHFGPVAGPSVQAQIARAYDACANMAAGVAHFVADWERAGVALQYYNSNKPNGAPRYAAEVLRRARTAPPLPVSPDAVPAAPPPCAPLWDAWALVACERRARRSAAPKDGAPSTSVPVRGAAGKVASNTPAQGNSHP